ncbi:M23 family metallopeptidase [Microbacterium caowuchunii]|uniref:M23 family metallopeptidase n=1 Tax=Microbacterium caowuchunii TaxID=2614638 RepID=A0A5N0TFA2_9MICO|nr:M23 family metallopeptidase [Microbacterium caowuchunii]KAA9133745.1 M23 family metallopeptidase [Microbacterium caowuchunii]
MQWPVAPTTAELSQPAVPYPAGSGGAFGWRADVGRMHYGYDFRAPAGRPAYAIAPGRVYFVASGMDDGTAAYPAGWAAGGRQVWIQHDGFMSRYLHLSEPQYAALRAGGLPIYFGGPGSPVDQGQLIGTVGGTNFAGPPYGAHLHLEIVVGGTQVDPIPFIQQRLAPPAPELPEESPMVHSLSVNGNLYAIGEEFITHHNSVQQATITRQVTSTQDELHTLNTADFTHLLDGLGIPRSVLDTNGRVLNPETGVHEVNGTWSRRREAFAAVKAARAAQEARLSAIDAITQRIEDRVNQIAFPGSAE